MLTIAPATLDALEQAGWPGYVRRATDDLAAEFPQVFTGYPPQIQSGIVQNMLGRARRWGINRQNAYRAFCGYMLAVAPNFDEEREIGEALRRAGPRINLEVIDLPDQVEDAAWDRAEAMQSRLPLFIPPDLIDAPAERHSAAAFALALGDRPEARDPARTLSAAAKLAQRLHLLPVADAPFILAACRSFFGDGFERHPDYAEALALAPTAQGAVMRLRALLLRDTGRYL